jgi:prepilin-type N-terminal cleavage/methylation domain-containing protein
MFMTRRAPADDAGYSLVELLVVVILLGVIGGIVSTAAISGMRSTRQTQNRAYSTEAIQAQLERMARDIRVADPIRAASATSITVDEYRGSTTCVREQWALTSGNLVVTAITYAAWASCSAYPSGVVPTSTVTRTVLTSLDTSITPLFTFADSSGTTLASPTPSQISVVRISVTQNGLENRAGVTFNTAVGVRNATLA